MSHEIEVIDGVAQMAYAHDVPWHGLGFPVGPDLTSEEMLEAAHLNWTVEKVPAFAVVNGKNVGVDRSALVRSSDNKVLDIVGNKWNPTQNSDAFKFFAEFVKNGNMSMETAGSLKGGQIIWGLAKINDSFTLFKDDKVDSYLLFTNPHKFGQAIDVRHTPIRAVCWNTLSLALAGKTDNMVKVSHRKIFDADLVKETLGLASQKLNEYKEVAEFLGSKKFTEKKLVKYFGDVFPVLTSKKDSHKKLSLSADRCLKIIENQPGAEFGKGTYWQAFNAVTYLLDHLIGRSADNRLTSSWFGANKSVKLDALELATKYAKAA